jgi:catechol 2,3-dioxygenase-like lactoylglutathione lyase family enzyme
MSYLNGIAHINLTVDDKEEAIEEARRFYVEILGLKLLPRPEQTDSGRPGLWLGIGNQEIHISMEKQATEHNRASRRHAAFMVKDLKALHRCLSKEGLEIDDKALQYEGQRRFFCRDQWGNRLEFVELQS